MGECGGVNNRGIAHCNVITVKGGSTFNSYRYSAPCLNIIMLNFLFNNRANLLTKILNMAQCSFGNR